MSTDLATLISDGIEAWGDCVKKSVDFWTTDPDLYGAYAAWIGALTNAYMGAKSGGGNSGPIPPGTTVDPKQAPATVTVTVFNSGAAAMVLRPTAFLDGARHYVPEKFVTLYPASVPPNTDQPVLVQVMPPIGTPSGKYAGAIVDDTGAPVVARVEVTVVTP
jgi:hypothetical protein